MAFTVAQTAALAKASGHLGDAQQRLTTILNNMRASHAEINTAGTWASEGAALFSGKMAQYEAELTKFITFMGQMTDNMGISGTHYGTGINNEASLVQQFSSVLNA